MKKYIQRFQKLLAIDRVLDNHPGLFEVERIPEDIERRYVDRKGGPVPIEYFAPRRGDADQTQPIVPGKFDILVRVKDLEEVQAEKKKGRRKDHQKTAHANPHIDNGSEIRHPAFAPDVR